MTEAQIFESLGRKQAVIELQDAAYQELLTLLANVVIGTIEPSRILVNMTARTWELAGAGQRPPLPATINGLPICIVAPAPKNGEAHARQMNVIDNVIDGNAVEN